MFGLSSNYWMALITRCLLGIMCGYLGPIKVPKHMVAGTHHHLHLPPFTSCSDNKFQSLLFTFHSNLFLIVSTVSSNPFHNRIVLQKFSLFLTNSHYHFAVKMPWILSWNWSLDGFTAITLHCSFLCIQAYATEVCRKEYNHLALAVVRCSIILLFWFFILKPQCSWVATADPPGFFLTRHWSHYWSSYWWLSCAGSIHSMVKIELCISA